ncbi:MAG TPA: DUF397 domain-containing protein [Trebonia sp.]
MPSRQSRRSAPVWRKSKASGGSGNCVEIAREGQSLLVRDSRNPSGAILEFSRGQWSAFMRTIRHGNGLA